MLPVVCVWMGTGGVLNYAETDGRPRQSSTSALHRQTVAAPVDARAACEWTQGQSDRRLEVEVYPT